MLLKPKFLVLPIISRLEFMDAKIDEMLENSPVLETESDLRSFLNKVKKHILAYEQALVEKEMYTRDTELLVNKWRTKILSIISQSQRTYGSSQVPEKHKDILETVKIASRQVEKANLNLSSLDNSTLKLVGLNYSSKDIENEITKTREILAKNKYDERKERLMVYLGVLVLLFVCLVILVDKFFIK